LGICSEVESQDHIVLLFLFYLTIRYFPSPLHKQVVILHYEGITVQNIIDLLN
jgi:hypothetical protein